MKFSILVLIAMTAALTSGAQPAFAITNGNPLTDSMIFAKLGPSSFWMGSPKDETGHSSDEVQHLVYLPREFEIQTTHVTQAQYIKVMGQNPSYFQERKHCPESFAMIQGVKACPNYPVERVSFDDIQHFLSQLNIAPNGPYVYRLPTEAEWEYAARGGRQSAYSFGDSISELGQYGWYARYAVAQTHAVARLRPNAWGLYDMHGNVGQWVQDWYVSDYPESSVIDPQGPPSGTDRVVRGGSWYSNSLYLRSASRVLHTPPYIRSEDIGFRLVRTR